MMITVQRLRELLCAADDEARVTIQDGDYGRDAGLAIFPCNGGDPLLIEVGRFSSPDYSMPTSPPETAAAKTTEATGPE